MKTNNPKDTKECEKCGVIIVKGQCACGFVLDGPTGAHYRGCHKVHIECANKLINDATDVLTHYSKMPSLRHEVVEDKYLCFGPIEAKIWLGMLKGEK